ncbi:4-hydroxy-tetrahydrodipicolinate synthase [Thermoanaerobacter brockii subsp. lactiethylicus]|jgi:4-hydroxy-tetrahydrodipicolinate synthase|uniref:4-hydroxy-tetrahydrodipicolinate synthase n=3 Tax=Thermoanaerobacter TaxID=1754 RepID=DAPA_THEP3|nr:MULTISPECIES: 4-hydroxy-tetrahydrodipicolinate synthase [Thermoanaerobacter]B0K4I3.1 RecName: Full=4-hydroxy-tetrahydrodipicolinate synthase; Short=HTPA synthase [Thermoanaerobacter sp. X514]B0KAL7.1 RecName: Full=4-hydroxy-tetrahydrodipicolinate synthase; Short=HTPA synthase [Thermoanaerobacter pseudethanolicus ATCC 33223]ABY93456.1 dihydrodipicolinate synthase [Thermoanaerobacter sp. X514]ABY95151.1 dihydrodipicolinate synthase [Thermoanaerobacter pseudethanolicus ATCC 33223]ADV80100.1 di
MPVFKGSGVAIVTPFNEEGVNFEKLGELIEWHIKEGTDAIIICGTTGEASTMTQEEQQQAIKFTVEKVAGRIPVIAGTGSNNTAHAVEMSEYAQSAGADALLVITPYYNKTTQKGLVAHFTEIARHVDIPIIIYNVPSRTSLNMLPETYLELSKHVDNVVGVKEASGDIVQVAEIARIMGKSFEIYSGNDDQVIPIMSLGGLGVISVTANIIPAKIHEMTTAYLNGDIEKARDMQLELNPLNKALFIETNPIPVKTAMNLMGFNVGPLRLPLVEMSDKNLEYLKSVLSKYGLLKEAN